MMIYDNKGVSDNFSHFKWIKSAVVERGKEAEMSLYYI